MRLARATPSSEHLDPLRDGRGLDGPDRRRAVGHGPRAQDGGKGPDLGGPRVGREKAGALNRTLRGRFRPDRRENGEINGLEASGQFLPGRDPEGRRGALSLGNGGGAHQWGLMTVGPCDSGTAGAIVELSLFLEGPRHGQPHLQDLRAQRRRRRLLQLVRREDMTSALNPHFRGGQDPRPATHPVNSACSGSPSLALHGVTIMRKIVACWTCGRRRSLHRGRLWSRVWLLPEPWPEPKSNLEVTRLVPP